MSHHLKRRLKGTGGEGRERRGREKGERGVSLIEYSRGSLDLHPSFSQCVSLLTSPRLASPRLAYLAFCVWCTHNVGDPLFVYRYSRRKPINKKTCEKVSIFWDLFLFPSFPSPLSLSQCWVDVASNPHRTVATTLSLTCTSSNQISKFSLCVGN
jgi:hypothetical protein